MITASHNPAADNGYKLYLRRRRADRAAGRRTRSRRRSRGLGPLSQIPAGPLDGPLVTRHGDEVAQAYLDAIIAASARPPPATAPRRAAPLRVVVYTPCTGWPPALALRAIERAGFPPRSWSPPRREPDPDFPTVAFPNPEEPGALDPGAGAGPCATAPTSCVANDPDGDRLAVAVPDPAAPAAGGC